MGLLDFLSLNKSAPDLTPAYTAIMALARRPDHYGDGAVPDSFDGRFDMLAAHVHVVLRRLRSEGVARDDIGQALFDIFFRDMDQAMREAGVGDLGVGKKIRKMAQAYYGRAAAYDEALGKAAPVAANAKTVTALAAVLQRNLYPDTPEAADVEKLKALASNLLALENELAGVTLDDILAGKF
ncbi:ubiquinol-cytochrome C chaperone [Alphaproteobacteria bacterium]|nr:ubiquinol-cytochrome C chaperone [Alphaproteobacteria bacterium]MDB2522628.1 ubiquinol-cytochrome C chaperone [Alphaproteobacteria bacterium]